MKTLTVIFLFVSFIDLFNEADPTDRYNISCQKAYELIAAHKNDPDFMIIDFRSIEAFLRCHLKHAEPIDAYSPDLKKKLDKLDRNNTYLIYCGIGVRSLAGLKIMLEMDFKNIHHMNEGIRGWRKNGYPVIKPE